MKIKSLQLKNFKRFTDLTLQDIPDNAKLVLLIGSNGSGKSSVFDAFELLSDLIHRAQTQTMNPLSFSGGKDYSYYHKGNNLLDINVSFKNNNIRCYFQSVNSGHIASQDKFLPNTFYGRSAVRYLSRLTKSSIGQTIDIAKDSDKPSYYIDEDKRFENDIDILIKDIVDKIFKGINTDSSKQLDEIKFFLDKINNAFPRIFGSNNGTKLSFKSFSPPAEGKPSQLVFLKGISEISYNLLSAGEKEIVNLLFNLFVRSKFYSNTVYFMDEIDTHLNTKLQFNLIKEITENWIPENCQLWTASHSLGFIQYAKESQEAVVLDIDDLDFDYPRVISPEAKDNSDIYDIAVNKELLPELFRDFDIIFVENEDKKYYASLNIERTLFIPEKNRDGVFHKAKSGQFKGLADRDFLTDDDINIIEQQYPDFKILRFYCVENYLFHPDNLEEYHSTKGNAFDKSAYIQKIFEQKEIAKGELLIKIASIRQGYPYFKEVGMEKSNGRKRFIPEKENYEQSQTIAGYLNSNQFEDYYKSFSMKDNCKSLTERQHINPIDLSKTNWFKTQIENIIK